MYTSVLVGDEIYILNGSNASNTGADTVLAYKPSTAACRVVANVATLRINCFGGMIGDKIYIFCGQQGATYLSTVDLMELIAKQYPASPSLLMYQTGKDTTFRTYLLSTKLIDALPAYFKDAMLFADGNITFPALYIGDGTQWTLARAAQ